jgi:outer membrane lipoprotein-sorting protein
MKILFLIVAFLLMGYSVQAQNAEEVIKKMKASVQQLNTIRFEMDKSCFNYFNVSNFKMKVDIVFDTNAPMLPLIRKMNFEFTELDSLEPKHNRKIFKDKQYITIKDYTRELLIDHISKDKLDNLLVDFQLDVFPFFESTAVAYLDSLFETEYKTDFMDMKKISYTVSSDTACLSGDCFLVKLSAPSDLSAGYNNDSNDIEMWVNYKEDNSYFWINKKTYFPERFRHEYTIENGGFGYYDDYRFTKIEKDVQINDSTFGFNVKNFKKYRIEENLPKGTTTIQEAFLKAPNISGITQNGDSINLYGQHSEIYIVDFWFSNCPTCLAAKSFIEKEIIAKYKTDKVMVLGVNPIDKSFSAVKRALKEDVQNYPYILSKEAAKQYHLSAYPGIYILNNRFEVIQSFNSFGERVEKEIALLISKFLK